MNIVDTSGWLEYIGETDRAKFFIEPIESISNLIVPSIILYETFKKLILESDENKALISLAHMQQAKIIDIDSSIALYAAKLSIDYKLPMADSIIYAIAKKYNAIIWTQDQHFESLENIKYFPKNKNPTTGSS